MLEGYYRIETRRRVTPPANAPAVEVEGGGQGEGAVNMAAAPARAPAVPPAAEPQPRPASTEVYFRNARILVPVEALTGYTAFAGVASEMRTENQKAKPEPIEAELAVVWVFLLVTILLRALGSRGVDADGNRSGMQWTPVIFSAVAYVLVVYDSGGHIVNFVLHSNQVFIANLLAVALGMIAPVLVPTLMVAFETLALRRQANQKKYAAEVAVGVREIADRALEDARSAANAAAKAKEKADAEYQKASKLLESATPEESAAAKQAVEQAKQKLDRAEQSKDAADNAVTAAEAAAKAAATAAIRATADADAAAAAAQAAARAPAHGNAGMM